MPIALAAPASLKTTSAGANHSASSDGIAHATPNSIASCTGPLASASSVGFSAPDNSAISLPSSIAAVARTASVIPARNTAPERNEREKIAAKAAKQMLEAGRDPPLLRPRGGEEADRKHRLQKRCDELSHDLHRPELQQRDQQVISKQKQQPPQRTLRET